MGGRKTSGSKTSGRKTPKTARIARMRASAGGRGFGRGGLIPAGQPRQNKMRVTMFLDADVLAWFKERGGRYQTTINCALRRVMAEEMKEAGE